MKSSQIERLAKLQELRSAGALTDEEFDAQKHALLAQSGQTVRWPYFAGLSVVALGSTVALGLWANRAPPSITPLPIVVATPAPSPSPSSPTDMRSSAERLTDAFEAATGHRVRFRQTINGEDFTVSPIKLLNLPFGPALLTRREIKDGCHACMGYIGVYYLRETAGQTVVTGSYPKAVEGWGWGAAPSEWQLTTRFTANPAIFASGGFMGQGVVESSSTLTELRPDGPVTSDVIGTGFSDSGAITDDDPRKACEVEGKITNISPDRSFDVIVSGSVSGRDRYIKKGSRFLAAKKIDWGLPCSNG